MSLRYWRLILLLLGTDCYRKYFLGRETFLSLIFNNIRRIFLENIFSIKTSPSLLYLSRNVSLFLRLVRPIQYQLNIPRSNWFLSVSQERLKSLGNMARPRILHLLQYWIKVKKLSPLT